MVTLTVCRYGNRIKSEHVTIQDAANTAYIQFDNGDIYPVSIEENGVTVWESDNPFDDSIEKLNELSGIKEFDSE